MVLGRAKSGKSSFCMNEAKEIGDSYYIVPEQFSFEAEKRLLEITEVSGLGGVEVISFRRLAHRLKNEVGTQREQLPPTASSIALRAILSELQDNLCVFSGSQKFPGFISEIAKTIGEFKRYNITPEALRESAEKIKAPLLKMKLTDLALIYSEYEKFIGERYLDSGDELSVLAENIRKSKQMRGAHIYIDQFSSFTPQEYDCIKSLMEVAACVTVVLCADPKEDSEIFAVQNKTLRRLARIGKIDKTIVMTGEFFENPEIAHLERNLFSSAPKVYGAPTERISLFVAKNEHTEIEALADRIAALVREKGYKFRDIAVISNNKDFYEKSIRTVFERMKIPYFIDETTSALNHGIVLFVLSALEIVFGSWNYESVFKYLKTGLTDIPLEDIDLLENFVLAAGVRPNSWTSEEKWDMKTSIFSDDGEGESDRIDEIRRAVAAPLIKLSKEMRGKNSAIDLAKSLYGFIEEIGLFEKTQRIVEELKNEDLRLAGEYSQVYNLLIETLDIVARTLGEKKLSPRDFYDILKTAFEEAEVGSIPAALDSVFVGDIQRTVGHSAKAVFLIGLNDGVIPPSIKEQGIFSDADRQNLSDLGIELAPGRLEQAMEEEHRIYGALCTAKEYLFISYPIAASTGEALRASPLVGAIKRIFTQIREKTDVFGTLDPISSPEGTFDRMVFALKKAMAGEELPEIYKEAYAWFKSSPEWAGKLTAAEEALRYKNIAPPLSREQLEKIYPDVMETSVSRLEMYARCPFSYFVKYVLGASERKVLKLGAPDAGTFLHTLIDEFSKRLELAGKKWVEVGDDYINAAIDEIIDSFYTRLNRYVLEGSPRLKFLFSKLKNIARHSLALIRDHISRGSFEPLGYEITFGRNGRIKPLTITLPTGHKIELTGRIDRLDACKIGGGSFVRVVDYKSGRKDFRLDEVISGLNLQLAVYLTAVCENGGPGLESPVRPAGMLYFKLDDPVVTADAHADDEQIRTEIRKKLKMKGLILADEEIVDAMERGISGSSEFLPVGRTKDGFSANSSVATAEQFAKLQKKVKKIVSEIAKRMLQGDISISPCRKGNFTPCSYCEYRAVCAFDIGTGGRYRDIPSFDSGEVWQALSRENES